MSDKNSNLKIKDIWNAYMVENASFSKNDIPFCPTTADSLPTAIITYSEAITIFNASIKKNPNFKNDCFVCFYQYDETFDGLKGIWNKPKKALRILRHFAGVITPDFSTFQDFPDPIKRHNTYRMRAFGYWLGTKGIKVINNVRWGTYETFIYCFDGIPRHSIIAIGTVGGSPKKLMDRPRFEAGLKELVKRLSPHTIIIYGSANYPCIEALKEQGITIVSFPGRTAQAYEGRKKHE